MNGLSRLALRLRRLRRSSPTAAAGTAGPVLRPFAHGPEPDVDGHSETSRIALRRMFESEPGTAPEEPVAAAPVPPRTLPPPPVLGGIRRAASPPRSRPSPVVEGPTVLSLFAAPMNPSGAARGGFWSSHEVAEG